MMKYWEVGGRGWGEEEGEGENGGWGWGGREGGGRMGGGLDLSVSVREVFFFFFFLVKNE